MIYVYCVISACISPIQEQELELDYTRISQPAVASRLELSAEQRSKIAQLLTDRINKLAASKPADRANIRKENNSALKAILTPTQQSKYKEILAGGKLRFNFRGEKWGDVLNWFAKQSELSLVMDQAPAGDFTYSDQKEYSSAQAIDLLNSVLLSKGFTLIRREKMLIVTSLEDGIPYELVPSETMEGLANRGKFEWVRISFPLGGRPVAAVLEEIKPMVGDFGKATPLTASGKVIVTETAGKMEAISILISAVPVPTSPPAPPKPAPPPPKVFVVHSAKGLDIAATVETLKTFFSTSAVAGDAKAEEIQVYAPQDMQDLIKASLDQMILNASVELKQYAETYSAADLSLSNMSERIGELFPDTKLTLDEENNRLVVIANGKQHKGIQEALEKLGATPQQDSDYSVIVYEAPQGEGENLATVLKEMLPRAQVIVQVDRIAVRGKSADQQIAKSLVEQITTASKKGASKQLRFYDLNENPPEVTETIQALVEDGTVSWIESRKKLAVIADNSIQELVKKTIDQINLDLPTKKKRSLKIFSVTPEQKSRFDSVFESLANEYVDVTLVAGSAPNEIAILADDLQQKSIEDLIQSIAKLESTTDKELTSVKVTVSDPEKLVTILSNKFPAQEFMINSDKDALIFWASKTEIEKLKKEISTAEAILPKRKVLTLDVYPVKGSISNIETLIEPILGNARLTSDSTNKRLIIWGTTEEHQKIKSFLEKIDGRGANDSVLQVYRLENGVLSIAAELIENLDLEANVKSSPESKSLLIWADAESHARIKELVDQLSEIKSAEKSGVEIYPVDRQSAEKTLAAVQAVFPDASISLDASSKKIIAIASQDLQAQIRALVEKLQPDKPAEPRILMSYELAHSDALAVVGMLQELHPDVRFAADERANRVLVTAGLTEQPKFKAIISQLDSKRSDRNETVLETYSIASISQQTLTDLIQPIFPEMKMTVDSTKRTIVAMGSAFEHQRLAQLLKRLSDKSNSSDSQLMNYSIGDAPVEQVQSVLLQVVPTAVIASNPAKKILVIWASKEEHKLIGTAIKQLTAGTDDLSIKTYELKRTISSEMVSLLQGISPNARIAASSDNRQLVVYASPSDHDLVKMAVSELQQPKARKTELKVYLGEEDVVSDASQFVTDTVPDARIVIQPDERKLLVWATDEDHEKIAKAFESLKLQLAPIKLNKSIVIYPLGKADKATVLSMISSDIKFADVIADSQSDRVIIRADKETHTRVAKLIGDLKKTFEVVKEKTIKSHAIRKDLKSQATDTIASLLPAVEFISNRDEGFILAKASSADHEAIDKLIETLEKEIASEEPRTIFAYPLKKMEKSLAIQILTGRFPDISVVDEPSTSRLLLWANKSDHAKLPELLDQLEKTIAVDKELVVQVYNIERAKMTAANALDFIDAELKANMTIQVAAETNSLIVRASPSRQQEFQKAIDAVTAQIKPAPKPSTKVYDLLEGNASSVSSLLAPLLSNATQSVSADGKKLAVTTGVDGHALVQSVIEQLSKKNVDADNSTVVYRLNAAVPSLIQQALLALAPKSNVIADDNSMSLIVSATENDHKAIANMLKQINDSTLGKKTEVFTLRVADPSALVSAISSLNSSANVTADSATRSVIVTARESDFPQIQSIVDKLDKLAGEKINQVVVKVYPFDQDLVDAVDMQGLIDPELREGMSIRINEVGNGLIIRTSPDKHMQLQVVFDQVIAQLPEKRKIETRVYRLIKVSPAAIENVLGAKYAASEFSVDSNTRTVVATVPVAEHDKIKSILTEMENQPLGLKTVSKAFKLKTATPRIVASALESLLPTASVAFDSPSDSVIVTGSEADLKSAAELVTQIDGSRLGKSTRVYKLVEADPRYIAPAVQALIPEAEVSAERYSKSLFVTASDEEHKQVAEMIDELNSRKDQRSEVYRLTKANPVYVMPAVKALLPNSTVSADRFSKSLFVTGSDDDHKQVEKLIEKMNGEIQGQRSEVYRLLKADPRYIEPAIQSLLPDATISGDRYSKSLFVTGTEADHKQVKQLVEKLNGSGSGQTTEVYRIEKANATVLQPAIEALIPEGTVTADKISNTIVVAASAADQLRVAEVVNKLDRASSDELVLKIYRSKFDNPDPLNRAISDMFRDDQQVRINFEWENRRILVVTTETKHKVIQSLIDQIDQGKPKYENRFARVYHLENIESKAAEGVVRNLYSWWAPRIDVRVEGGTNALIIVATDNQHKDLSTAIKEVDGDLRQLEVFPLVSVDPYTIEMAVEELFSEIPENMRPSATSDFGTQQLFVRGTGAQINLIRDLLNKMGENFGNDSRPLSKGGVRTIPFRGNAMEALREIEAIWPRIRKNKIEIIRPGGTKINRLPRRGKSDLNLPKEPQSQSDTNKEESVDDCGGNGEAEWSTQQDGKTNNQQDQPRIHIEDLKPIRKNDDSKPATSNQEKDNPQIVIIAGTNEITIASSDHEALDQLEYLLRTMQRNQRSGIGSSNFAVFLLANSSAKDTAKLLTDLFEAIPETERQGSVGNAVFVADDRLNAMIVYGTRKERDVIKEIIEVLDAEDLPDSLTTPLPELVQIENSSASRVLEILRSVYSNQLTSGGGRPKVEIPEGVTSAVASILQQINAATAGPILTLGIDEKTNSIVMRAPAELGNEIKSFIQRLDNSAKTTNSKKIRVLQLQGTNADRVRQILNQMNQ